LDYDDGGNVGTACVCCKNMSEVAKSLPIASASLPLRKAEHSVLSTVSGRNAQPAHKVRLSRGEREKAKATFFGCSRNVTTAEAGSGGVRVLGSKKVVRGDHESLERKRSDTNVRISNSIADAGQLSFTEHRKGRKASYVPPPELQSRAQPVASSGVASRSEQPFAQISGQSYLSGTVPVAEVHAAMQHYEYMTPVMGSATNSAGWLRQGPGAYFGQSSSDFYIPPGPESGSAGSAFLNYLPGGYPGGRSGVPFSAAFNYNNGYALPGPPSAPSAGHLSFQQSWVPPKQPLVTPTLPPEQLVFYKYTVVTPDRKKYKVDNLVSFCRFFGLSVDMMYKVAAGKIKNHRGWVCTKVGEQDQEKIRHDPTFGYISREDAKEQENAAKRKLKEQDSPPQAESSAAETEAKVQPQDVEVRSSKKRRGQSDLDFVLPAGWQVEKRERKTGVAQGAKYTVYKAPDGRVFRTKAEVVLYESSRRR